MVKYRRRRGHDIRRDQHPDLQWPQPEGETHADEEPEDGEEGPDEGEQEIPWNLYRVNEVVRQRIESLELPSVNVGNLDPRNLVEEGLLDSDSDSPGGPAAGLRRLFRNLAGPAAAQPTQIDVDLFEYKETSTRNLRTRTFFRNLLNQSKIEFEDRYKFPKVSNARPSDYTLLKTIGKGSFGKVFLVTHRRTGQPYALKALEKSHVVKEKQIAHTLSEKRILAAVRFPFLCHLVQHFKDNANLYMVLPFCSGGDLFGHLVKTKGRFKEDQARFFVAQVVLAFEYLHFNNVIYRDLKPENIMLMGTGYIKLSDFGFAKIVKGRTWTLCGTPEYLAPELIYNKGYGKSVDWWAIGVLTYELNTGGSPFYSATTSKMYEKILAARYRTPKHFNRDLRNFVSSLLTVNPVHRLGNSVRGINDIKFHPYFKKTDWTLLYKQDVPIPYTPHIKGPVDTGNFDKFKELPLKTARRNLYEREFRKF